MYVCMYVCTYVCMYVCRGAAGEVGSVGSISLGTPGCLIKKPHVKKFRGWISVKNRDFLTRGGGGLEKHMKQNKHWGWANRTKNNTLM